MGIRSSYIPISQGELQNAANSISATGELTKQVPISDWADVDKAWDILFWIFDPARREVRGCECNPSTMLGKAIVGSKPVNESYSELYEELSLRPYHYKRCLSNNEVKFISEALNEIGEKEFLKLYRDSSINLSDIYCSYEPKELYHIFERLKNFYTKAARNNNAVVVSIS